MSRKRLDLRKATFRRAKARFDEAIAQWAQDRDDIIRDSLIKRFEFTFELAWKTMQDWIAVHETDLEVRGPRQVIEGAASRLLVRDPDRWAELLKARNLTVHIYDEDQIATLAITIADIAPALFDALAERLDRND